MILSYKQRALGQDFFLLFYYSADPEFWELQIHIKVAFVYVIIISETIKDAMLVFILAEPWGSFRLCYYN